MRQSIQITDRSANEGEQSGCCGGACCTPAADTGATPVSSTHTFAVEGMTCQHCVASVTEELAGLAGVESVRVELVPGGRSLVRVTADAPLRGEDVRAAISEAGYALLATSATAERW